MSFNSVTMAVQESKECEWKISNVFSCTDLPPKVRTPGRIRIRKTINLYFLLFLGASPASFHF